jgi:AcrR family transcriptional regulator
LRYRVQKLNRRRTTTHRETLAPTGLARRARRLPEEQTEHLMLQTAVAMVRRSGLTVSLDHISLEDVIRAANVPRSSVYRRWPTRIS